MTAVANFVFSARLTVASIALNGLACGPTRMTGFEDCTRPPQLYQDITVVDSYLALVAMTIPGTLKRQTKSNRLQCR